MADKRLGKIGWGAMLVAAALTFVVVSRYLAMNPDLYPDPQRENFIAHPIGLMMHVIGGMTAIILGPFQFSTRLRTRRLALHRWLGRLYLVGILVGGAGGFFMAFFAWGGFSARLGFGTLAVLWLFSGYQAYGSIRRREIEAHKRWMARNYSLTFGAATLRIYLTGYMIVSGMGLTSLEFVDFYRALAWIAWVPNLILVEWYFARKERRVRPVSEPAAA